MTGVAAADARTVFRRHHFRVREATGADGTTYLYGDRNQYTKMATLLTHTGLVLFLVAAAVTSRLGDEQGLVVAGGRVAHGPADRDARPAAGEEPRLRGAGLRDRPGRRTSRPTSRSTRTARRSPTRRSASTTRWRSAATRSTRTASGRRRTSSIRDADGKPLWDGPIPMTDAAAGFPFADSAVPGRDVVLQLLLQRADDGRRACSSCSRSARRASTRTGRPSSAGSSRSRWPGASGRVRRGRACPSSSGTFGEYTLLIAKHDPGQGIVWLAFGSPDRRPR